MIPLSGPRRGLRLNGALLAALATAPLTSAGQAVPVGGALNLDGIVQRAYLKASNTRAGDGFGYSVAVADDTVVVGTQGQGAYVFTRLRLMPTPPSSTNGGVERLATGYIPGVSLSCPPEQPRAGEAELQRMRGN